MPSGLKRRTAGCPDPGVGTVPELLAGELKLPPVLF